MSDYVSGGPRYQRCPRECRPVDASVIRERDLGHVLKRLMRCHTCGQRWWQLMYRKRID